MDNIMWSQIGKMLLIFGVVLIVVGLVIIFAGRIPFIGKLPGDFSISHGKWSFYFPLATSIILSILLTILFNLFGRGR